MRNRKKPTTADFKRQNDYNRINYDRISIMLPKGTREVYKEYAQKNGMSLNALVCKLLDKEINK